MLNFLVNKTVMSYLSFEVVRRSCAFVMEVDEPEETMKKLMQFFIDRHIVIDSLQMHRYGSGNASVIIHCRIEKDRVARTVQLMEQLPGVLGMERMEGR